MALEESALRLEVGTEGWEELTEEERTYLLGFSSLTLAALRAFDLLRKKYRPTYRLGRTWEDLDAKYRRYEALFREYRLRVAQGALVEEEEEEDETS